MKKLLSGWSSFNLDEYVGLGDGDPCSFRSHMQHYLGKLLGLNSQQMQIPDGKSKDPEKEAISYLEKGLAIAQELGDVDITKESTKLLFKAYEKSGNFEKAFEIANLTKSEKELIEYIRYIGTFNQVSLTTELRLKSKPPVLSVLCEICRKIGDHIPDHTLLL